MLKTILKKTLRLTCSCAVLLVSSTMTAAPTKIPQAIEIPEALRDGKLLDIHKTQIDARIAWWKYQLIKAITDEGIQRAGEKLLGDYQLYPNPSYQQAFAAETLRQYRDVLNGKAFAVTPDDPDARDDPLVLLKRINAALILTQMDQPEMEPGLRILIAEKNEALRYIGYLGYEAMRKQLLAGTETNLKPMLEAVKKAAADETNPILLAAIYRTMNLATVEGNVNENLRRIADKAFLQALQPSWATRCKQAQTAKTAEGNLLPALRIAILALESIGNDLKRAEPKDDASVTLCLQMVFEMTNAAAQTYDRAWQNRTVNTALLEQCAALLSACESALNTLTGEKNTFLAEKLNTQNTVPARGAAVMEAVLVHWTDALKDKGVKESPAEK